MNSSGTHGLYHFCHLHSRHRSASSCTFSMYFRQKRAQLLWSSCIRDLSHYVYSPWLNHWTSIAWTALKKPFLWIQRIIKCGILLEKVDVKVHTNLIPSHMCWECNKVGGLSLCTIPRVTLTQSDSQRT